MVFNKGEGTPPLPAIEMISQENTTTQVVDMLTHLRQDFRKVNNKELKVKTIVTDHSWPNINAILSAFQLGNICSYLDLLWDTEISQYTGTIIKLCYAHIMKNVSSKAKKYLPTATSQQRYALLVLFSRMADCTSKQELDENFKQMAIILLSPTLNCETLNNITCLTKDKLQLHSDVETDTEQENKQKSIEPGTRIRDRCAAGRHFDDMARVIKESIGHSDDSEPNDLYSPALLENLLTNLLPYAPLWSSLHGKRKTNAIVENHHKIIKHDVLKERVDVASFLTCMFRNVKQRAREYAADFAPRQKVKKKRTAKCITDDEERWFKKGRKRNNTYLRLVSKLDEGTKITSLPGYTESQCQSTSAVFDNNREEATHFEERHPRADLKAGCGNEHLAMTTTATKSTGDDNSMAESFKCKNIEGSQGNGITCKENKTSTEILAPNAAICGANCKVVDEYSNVGSETIWNEICNQKPLLQRAQKRMNMTVGQTRHHVKQSDNKLKYGTRRVRAFDMSTPCTNQLLFNSSDNALHEPSENQMIQDVTVLDLNWVSVDGIRLTIRNKTNILNDGGWLTSDEIDAFIGLINNSNLKYDPETKMPLCLTVCAPKPLHSPFQKYIQIINTQNTQSGKTENKGSLGSHWVVLSNNLNQPCSESGTVANVAYFCSLGCKPTPDIIRYLFNIYKEIPKVKQINIHIHGIQKQTDGSSCGLFALANATALAQNFEPSLIQYKIEEMRRHTAKCLQDYVASSFPTTRFGINFTLINNKVKGFFGPRIREVLVLETARD